MRKTIIILLAAIMLSTAVVYDSSQDIQRIFRARAMRAKRKDTFGLFIDD